MSNKDLSGVYKGTWKDLKEEVKGNVELKIYSDGYDGGSYRGYLLFQTSEGEVFTGNVTVNMRHRYFYAQYAPSCYNDSSNENVHILKCMLHFNGIMEQIEGKYSIKGEAVIDGGISSNFGTLLHFSLDENELIGKETDSAPRLEW
ncbi:hypothetical protein AAG747_25910 [Rapidithrix thailandica]|uniref:Uncharacterized protein n=1 Tax=Rapidithrix thailandica TaxID=413964 RepID=A0AAW9SBT6_9BACT